MSKGFLSQWWDWCSAGALVPWCDRVRHEDQWGRDPLIPSPLLVGSHALVCKYGIPWQRDHHRAPSKQHQKSLCIVQAQVFWKWLAVSSVKGRPSLELLRGNYLLAGSKRQGRIAQSQKKRDGRWICVGLLCPYIGCRNAKNGKFFQGLDCKAVQSVWNWEIRPWLWMIKVRLQGEKSTIWDQIPSFYPTFKQISFPHKYIFYQASGDLQKTRESNLSFWKKVKGFSSEMVLNKLAMASLCAVRSVVGDGGDGEEGAEGWCGKVNGEEDGEEWIFEWCRKSPGVGKDLGHSGHGWGLSWEKQVRLVCKFWTSKPTLICVILW